MPKHHRPRPARNYLLAAWPGTEDGWLLPYLEVVSRLLIDVLDKSGELITDIYFRFDGTAKLERNLLTCGEQPMQKMDTYMQPERAALTWFS